MIRFSAGRMVVGETITRNDLLSVYQGNANAMSDKHIFDKFRGWDAQYIPGTIEEDEVISDFERQECWEE